MISYGLTPTLQPIIGYTESNEFLTQTTLAANVPISINIMYENSVQISAPLFDQQTLVTLSSGVY